MANEVDTTLLDNLNSIKNSKADIKQALIDKGQNPTNVFADYAQLISDIQTGEDLSEELSAQEAKLAQLESILDNKTAGGKIKLNIYAQPTEPTEKDGIWLETTTKIDISKITRLSDYSSFDDYKMDYTKINGGVGTISLPSWAESSNYNYLLAITQSSSDSYGFVLIIAKGTIYYSVNNSSAYFYCNEGLVFKQRWLC